MSTESLISSRLENNNDGPPPLQTKMGSPKAIIIVSSLGLIVIVIGLAVGLLWTTIFNGILLQQLILTPTSKSFSLWKQTPIPMYLEFHLFNWTNPDDFNIASGIKPNFVEMGPYVFKEVDSKVNKVWNHNNGTVTFQQNRVWHFVESMSNGSLSDRVTNLNPVTTTVAYMMRHKNKLIKILINSAIKVTGEKLTVTKTVNELLFNGYEDELMDKISKFNTSLIPYDKFGWFYSRNNSDSYDGTFNMLTGSKNIEDLGTLTQWQYSNKSKSHSASCGTIHGSLGDLWPPLEQRKTVSVFAPDICTSLNLVYNNATEYLGLSGREYISNRDMLDNGTRVPSRACYCENIDCQPSGVLNISQCKFGAPAFISLPHFYLADGTYRSAVDGMKPRKEKHQFSVVIEPTAGIPMHIRARLQLNLLVQPDSGFDLYKNVPRTFVPMLWFTQQANLSSSLANEVKFALILPMLGHATFFGIAGLGALLMFIGIGLYIRRRRQADDGQSLIPKTSSTVIDG